MNFDGILKAFQNFIHPQVQLPGATVNVNHPVNGLPPAMQAELDAKNAAFLKNWNPPQAATPTPTQAPTTLDQVVQAVKQTPQAPSPTPTLLPDAPVNPYMDIIKKYFPPDQVNNASNVMYRESRFNPTAIGQNTDPQHSKDHGLFQINDYWQRYNLPKQGLTLDDLLDPEKNIRYAAQMEAKQGWSPWSTSGALGLK